jgi:tyrosyl-tRNA synthetase
MPQTDLLAELSWRGLLHQYTDGLPEWLAARAPVSGYCGFDPSAPSLHVGNLVPVMALLHLQRAGHRPVILVGGGTGLIGDPSGKTLERQLHAPEVVEANTRRIESQLRRFLDFDGATGAIVRDNATWLRPLGAIDFMRDVGKHFRVNAMLQKESVRARLESETGISYTEFSYMLLQAYDFVELNRRDGVTLQVGGSDQWGNITAGIDLVGRMTGGQAHGFTVPLIVNASGTKFGKSESGAVWLDPAQTSPYRFYQFWINSDDRDVGRYLRFFTLLPRERIEALAAEMAERPEQRAPHRALARDVTARVHGESAARVAEEVSQAMFGADPRALSLEALEALEHEVPSATIGEGDGAAGESAGESAGAPHASLEGDIPALLVRVGLAKSRSEARRLVAQGGVYVNGARVAGDGGATDVQPLHGRYYFIQRGRQNKALVRVARPDAAR